MWAPLLHLASEVMTEINSWLERSDYSRTGCVKKCNRRLSAWREPCGTPAAEVMTRGTAGRYLKRVCDSCSTGGDTWNRREVLEESHVTAQQLLYLAYSLFLSLTLTTFAINTHKHTSSRLYGLQYSSWLSLGPFLSRNGHSPTTFM